MRPTPEKQIQFLVNLQRLLDEGLFVASYKFALLLSLTDLSVEKGDDSGAELLLSTDCCSHKCAAACQARTNSDLIHPHSPSN
jgi:hypothetical protein